MPWLILMVLSATTATHNRGGYTGNLNLRSVALTHSGETIIYLERKAGSNKASRKLCLFSDREEVTSNDYCPWVKQNCKWTPKIFCRIWALKAVDGRAWSYPSLSPKIMHSNSTRAIGSKSDRPTDCCRKHHEEWTVRYARWKDMLWISEKLSLWKAKLQATRLCFLESQ